MKYTKKNAKLTENINAVPLKMWNKLSIKARIVFNVSYKSFCLEMFIIKKAKRYAASDASLIDFIYAAAFNLALQQAWEADDRETVNQWAGRVVDSILKRKMKK